MTAVTSDISEATSLSASTTLTAFWFRSLAESDANFVTVETVLLDPYLP